MLSFLIAIHEEENSNICEAIEQLVADFVDNNLAMPRTIEIGHIQFKNFLAQCQPYMQQLPPYAYTPKKLRTVHGDVDIVRVNEPSALRAK